MSKSDSGQTKASVTAKVFDWISKLRFLGYIEQELQDFEMLNTINVGESVTPTIPFFFKAFGKKFKIQPPIERVE